MTLDQYAKAREALDSPNLGAQFSGARFWRISDVVLKDAIISALAAAGQLRTHGAVEVCGKCGERENGEAWEYNAGTSGASPWRECPQTVCPLLRADRGA